MAVASPNADESPSAKKSKLQSMSRLRRKVAVGQLTGRTTHKISHI